MRERSAGPAPTDALWFPAISSAGAQKQATKRRSQGLHPAQEIAGTFLGSLWPRARRLCSESNDRKLGGAKVKALTSPLLVSKAPMAHLI